MKNILRSTLYLTVFALAGILFQISCSNSESANSNTNQTGKLVYMKQANGGFLELWICNNDGTGQTQIPVAFPANVDFSGINSNRSSVKISPDGQKIFFVALNSSTNLCSIYSCDLTGNNLVEIVNGNFMLELGGVN
jgi:Tol biopolymer transport system component